MLRRSTLQGFQAPGMEYRIVVTMFADDTTVYLRESDKFEDLQEILQQWCRASGAKFNITKTEVIPMGPEEYRTHLLNTRQLKDDQLPIPPHIHIAKDGEATRVLGAWIGNKTNDHAIWSPTLEKIDRSLERWEQLHPSIEGRKIIIQRTIGSMTQYLTKAQGMPSDIESTLIKRLKKFIWDGNGTPSISLKTMESPVEQATEMTPLN
ncbi:hypothetical protein PAXINDRAFT_164705 [Paxillus involutus ATCC 200175]|uniref:Reverse transcriptase domain-containing protein n=1 Tax=Paxillus involutus ATCC 200175 TaxID=664439 RepID=A0A0C9SUP5_PAXIN|nr:hypothetical protein PAXINDRAFT_164705 [Paxillus involutus ATCC 200175]